MSTQLPSSVQEMRNMFCQTIFLIVLVTSSKGKFYNEDTLLPNVELEVLPWWISNLWFDSACAMCIIDLYLTPQMTEFWGLGNKLENWENAIRNSVFIRAISWTPPDKIRLQKSQRFCPAKTDKSSTYILKYSSLTTYLTHDWNMTNPHLSCFYTSFLIFCPFFSFL